MCFPAYIVMNGYANMAVCVACIILIWVGYCL